MIVTLTRLALPKSRARTNEVMLEEETYILIISCHLELIHAIALNSRLIILFHSRYSY
jgi:hypothetical protein